MGLKFLNLQLGKVVSSQPDFADISGSATLAQGGTNNSSLMATAGGLLYTDGTKIVNMGAGLAGQTIISGGSGAPTWGAAVSGSSGSKNYITNGNFENNAATGWSLGTTGTLTNGLPTGTPTFGSGADSNLSISVVGSGQLAGSYSLSYDSTTATVAGDMLATQAYSIDLEDQAKVLTFKFYYSAVTNPTNINFSGTSSNSLAVAIWDVTNSQWIQPAGCFGMTQGTGVGLCTGTFQTPSNMTQFRLVVYNANATAGAATLYFDDFFVGPQTAPIGPIVTDLQTYTPALTTFGSGYTVTNSQWRRVGDSIEIFGIVLIGSGPGGNTFVPLPAGLTTDGTKLPTGGVYTSVGSMNQDNQSTPCFPIATGNDTGFYFGYFSAGSSGSLPQTITVAGHYLGYSVKIPIQGWSSNVQMSSDTDTRIVVASAQISSTFSGTNANPIVFDQVNFDNTASYNNSTGLFKAPITGYYRVTATIQSSSGSGIPVYAANTTTGKTAYIGYTNGTGILTSGSVILQANAGDSLGAFSGGSAVYNTTCVVNFERLTGPSVIAASESVNASYGLASNISYTGNTPIVYDTKQFDSHNAFNISTGVYTIPVSGVYRVGGIYYNSGTGTFFIIKNGVTSSPPTLGSMSGAQIINGTILMKLLAGDTISLAGDQNGTVAGGTPPAFANMFNIERVGN